MNFKQIVEDLNRILEENPELADHFVVVDCPDGSTQRKKGHSIKFPIVAVGNLKSESLGNVFFFQIPSLSDVEAEIAFYKQHKNIN